MMLAFVEHENGTAIESSLETLAFARDLSSRADEALEAVVIGEASAVADDLGIYGVKTVHGVEHDRLDAYAPQAWAESVNGLVDDLAPETVIAPGSDRGHEVLAHVASLRGLPMAANCIAVAADGSDKITRQRWGGSLSEHVTFDTETRLLTVPPHEFDAEPSDETVEDVTTHTVSPSFDNAEIGIKLTRFEESDEKGVPLEEARVVVGGGRGVGGPEDYDKLETLADLLGGTVGASRAAVNEGWRPHDDQIGLTGAKISPDIYIACGISGAVQHMVGCKGAETILAINTDPEAAIMQQAEYTVIGDLHEVVPAINEAIRDGQ